MPSFEERIKRACDTREIPGVVLLAVDRTGQTIYQNAFGPATLTSPMSLDSTFTMASCTKLLTSISALQCVERGLIGLDDDVSPILTELKDIEILESFEKGGKPVLRKAENKITLRQLLTHTSGFSYDAMDPRLMRWRTFKGQLSGTKGMGMLERIRMPLLFEPGTSWGYGVSTDWAGLLVARLSGVTLEEYMQKNVWGPVGAEDITFHSEIKPDVKKRLVRMSARGGIVSPISHLPVDTGEKVEWLNETLYDDPIPTGDEFGGQGCMGSGSSYIKILTSLLLNDSKLLKHATLDLMFSPQLSDASRDALVAWQTSPFFKDAFASNPAGTSLDYGLGGMLTGEKETGRRAGTLTWSGMPNLLWTIDREAGLACFYASNVVPFGDPRSHVYQQMFEKEVYGKFGKVAKL